MEINIRPIKEHDVADADRIIRLAFGTFLGVPDPMTVFGDADFAHTRYRAAPNSAFVAEVDGRVVGSNFVTRWGTFGFFGPLSIEPQLWNQGVAQKLLEPTMEMFTSWGCSHTGLFTFSHSAKHAALYQKFGFWSRFLTPVMSKEVSQTPAGKSFETYSELAPKPSILAQCRALTDMLYEGLDVSREIEAVNAQQLGETVLLIEGSRVVAFAVCHVGGGTEAGSGACYVKFAGVKPGPSAQVTFERLLAACESFAAKHDAKRLVAGVNSARHEAYRTMVEKGFRADMLGVAMHRNNEPGFCRPGVYVLDDWR